MGKYCGFYNTVGKGSFSRDSSTSERLTDYGAAILDAAVQHDPNSISAKSYSKAYFITALKTGGLETVTRVRHEIDALTNLGLLEERPADKTLSLSKIGRGSLNTFNYFITEKGEQALAAYLELHPVATKADVALNEEAPSPQ